MLIVSGCIGSGSLSGCGEGNGTGREESFIALLCDNGYMDWYSVLGMEDGKDKGRNTDPLRD